MTTKLSLLAVAALSLSVAYGQQRTITDNLEYKFGLENGPKLDIAQGRTRNVRITAGGDELFGRFMKDPATWVRLPFLLRIAHTHPGGTISFQERGSPSRHFMFVPLSTGEHEIRAHIDLCGPGSVRSELCHVLEIARNRATFGRTDQDEVFRKYTGKPPKYDRRAKFNEYLARMFSPASIASTVGSSGFMFLLQDSRKPAAGSWLADSIERHFFDRSIRKSIEYGSSIGLRQDVSFKPCSTCTGFGSRLGHALIGSVTVQGYDNHREFAFPRFATAIGTGYAESAFYPGAYKPIDPLQRTGTIMLEYLGRSLYGEFCRKPVQKIERKALSFFGR